MCFFPFCQTVPFHIEQTYLTLPLSQQTVWFAHELKQEVAKKEDLAKSLQRYEAEKEEVTKRANLLEEKYCQELDDAEHRAALADEQAREVEEKIRLLEEKFAWQRRRPARLMKRRRTLNENSPIRRWRTSRTTPLLALLLKISWPASS